MRTTRRKFLAESALAALGTVSAASAQTSRPGVDTPRRGQRRRSREETAYELPAALSDYAALSVILGRVTDRSATLSLVPRGAIEACVEWGSPNGPYAHRTKPAILQPNKATEFALTDLARRGRCRYRVLTRKPDATAFTPGAPQSFHMQRPPGEAFTFTVQGDSHPERPQMSDPALYARTLQNVAADTPDFHICMGDDFSVDTLRECTADTVASRYLLQRPFLGIVGRTAPVFLVNGNHEHASLYNYNQKGLAHDVAVWAQLARNQLYPLPTPDGFYSGNIHPLPGIGPLRDYHAWTWGDALFVVLDNYWHSPAAVDGGFGERESEGDRRSGHKNRDWWAITLGDEQYAWFRRTLETSTTRYKFVFAHHVMGTGRGGIERARLYEWGGQSDRGGETFAQRRPGWPLPIHDLMVKHGVTIFLQGHDHLYARQELDGIIYQEVPMPADAGYSLYNADRYLSGLKLANAGHLRVRIERGGVRVEYVRSYLPAHETAEHRNRSIAHAYTASSRTTS